jgi:cholesterol transport system auxiliary component
VNKLGKMATIVVVVSNLSACAIKPTVINQYQLDNYSDHKLYNHAKHLSILVNLPESASAYQTAQMLYIDKPYQLNSFAYSAWINPPADLLFPSMIKSIQHSGYFYAVASSTNSEQTDYRVDTQLIELNQVFLTKPSHITFIAKVILTHVPDKRVVSSVLIKRQVACPTDTPYGGVIAANKAVIAFTQELTHFIITQVEHDSHIGKITVK